MVADKKIFFLYTFRDSGFLYFITLLFGMLWGMAAMPLGLLLSGLSYLVLTLGIFLLFEINGKKHFSYYLTVALFLVFYSLEHLVAGQALSLWVLSQALMLTVFGVSYLVFLKIQRFRDK